MRFKRRFTKADALSQISVIPFVNLIFLLFIFCLLTSSFISEPGIGVKLPKVVTSDTLQGENIVITITSENVIYLNGTISTIKELTGKLSQSETKGQSVLIKADRRSSVGRIVDVWDLCRQLGIEHINIATNQKH